MQRLMLLTDGSMTLLLEIYTENPVMVKTLKQETIRATGALAAKLRLEVGADLNYREVILKDDALDKPLLYACSLTPLSRLTDEFREDLLRADIPIGKIMKRHGLEFRRDLTRIEEEKASAKLIEIFGLNPREKILKRFYDIIHRKEILISIMEAFPAAYYRS